MQALGLVWGEVDATAPDYREHSQPLAAPRHPGAQLTFDVWQGCMDRDGFVVGRDLPSRALTSVLRNLAVHEPVDAGQDWRVRIAGTAFYRRFSRDVTGERFSQLFDRALFESRSKILRAVAADGRPIFREVERAQGTRMATRYEMLLLPALSSDRSTVWIATGLFYYDWAR